MQHYLALAILIAICFLFYWFLFSSLSLFLSPLFPTEFLFTIILFSFILGTFLECLMVVSCPFTFKSEALKKTADRYADGKDFLTSEMIQWSHGYFIRRLWSIIICSSFLQGQFPTEESSGLQLGAQTPVQGFLEAVGRGNGVFYPLTI